MASAAATTTSKSHFAFPFDQAIGTQMAFWVLKNYLLLAVQPPIMAVGLALRGMI